MTLPQTVRRALPAVIGLVLFMAALEVLRVELRSVSWHALRAAVLATPLDRLTLAIVLTAINYAALTGYDVLAFIYVANPLPRLRIAAVSFLAYAVSNNVGFAAFSGASVRYRFYTRWGVTAKELSRIVFSYSVTFWLGLFALGGLSLAVSRLPEGAEIPVSGLLAPLGWIVMTLPFAYIAATVIRRKPIRLWSFELPLPSPRIAWAQLLLSAVDWSLAGAVLYVLLPSSALAFLPFLGIFLVAILLGMLSHVPGGMGVFEGLMVLLLKPYLVLGRGPAGARRVSRGVLPAPAVGGAGGAGRGRNLAAPRACVASGGCRRRHDRAADAEGARRVHVSRGRRPAPVGRHARRAGATPGAGSGPPAGRDRSVTLPWQRAGRDAPHPVAGPGTPARRGLLPDGRRHARRHGGVAAERVRLRRSGPPAAGAGRAVASAPRLRSPRGVLRDAFLGPVDRRGGGRHRRIGVARPLRVQARRVLAPVVVAVRAAERRVALSARIRRCRHRRGRRSACSAWCVRRPTKRRPPPTPIWPTPPASSPRSLRPTRSWRTCGTSRSSSTTRGPHS